MTRKTKKKAAKKKATKKTTKKRAASRGKKKTTKKKRGGRPRKNLDWKQIDKMAEIHCTEEEIAAVVGCSIETLRVRAHEVHGCSFLEYLKQKQAVGKRSLRRKQYQVAMKGDRTMLVWIGKNWLGQSDKSQLTGAGGGPLQFSGTVITPEQLKTMTEEQLHVLHEVVSGLGHRPADAERDRSGDSSEEG